MIEPNNHPPTDPQTEELIRSLKNEITSLKSNLEKKDDRIETLENMVNTTMKCLNARTRGWEDLEDKLQDVVDMLRKRVPHCDILDFLKVRDSEEMRNYRI